MRLNKVASVGVKSKQVDPCLVITVRACIYDPGLALCPGQLSPSPSMFFTPELLSRRDSGFGLLWLAATLGARSSFNRLPKRDVMGADITQLCDLIAEPAEPLALRLSSNLMVGVARVYKVKHDIFLGDVSACFVSLKRAVRDLHALSASSHLQMGQPIVKRDAVTVNFDPLGLNLDDFLGDWQDIMDVQEEDGSDDEYGKPRKKPKSQDKRRPPHTEVGRATRHTLDENLEQMMSGSLEMSFLSGVEGEQQRLSPHMDTGFDFGDSEDFGFDVIGEELAKELGEGWASAPVHQKRSSEAEQQFSVFSDRVDANMDFGLDGDFAFTGLTQRSPDSPASGNVLTSRQSPSKKRNFDSVAADTLPQSPGDQPHVLRTPTPPWAFDTEVDGPGNGITGIVTERTVPSGEAMSVPRKTKRVRVQVDTRIELTNEELKKARAHYVEDQEAARRSIEGKRLEKEGSRLISQMLYGAPPILKAPVLVDFWMDNFKVLVEARSGALHMKTTG
ncbi:Rec8 like protein-domain-containing protein, partial [Russula brevipes]